MSRRQALLLGGLGIAGTATGGAGLIWTLTTREPPVTGSELIQPPVLRSNNGQLQVRLEAAPGQILLAGRQAAALGYNGGIPGPTLRVQAGDVLKIRLVNNLDQPTNLHVHGLHVSPEDNGDNVFISVDPGNTFNYEYKLPEDHPPGVYWYHPHHHGMVADQIFAGLFGAIIVEDVEPIEVSTERVLVISDTTLDRLGNIVAVPAMERMMGREGELVLVNGQSNPQLSARPRQRERWRIINTCVSRYLRLQVDEGQLQLLGMDSGRLPTPESVDRLLLLPGNRADLLISIPAGDSVLRAFYQRRGRAPGMTGRESGARNNPAGRPDGFALATLHVSGEPVASLTAPTTQKGLGDLRLAPIAARREIVMAGGGMGGGMGMGMMRFTINGNEFNRDRTDTTVAAGNVEEWTLTNTGPMDHPFHLHVWPMQTIEENGQVANTTIWRDVVNVPANGSVKVRVAFNDFRGRSVYHCHILDHEDLGMMGTIEVR
ncbi:multicopper oxidase family protein [Arthrobacter sp. Sr33]